MESRSQVDRHSHLRKKWCRHPGWVCAPYIDKYEAEKAAKRVAGVLAVANDIEIRLPAIDERSDPEIARDVPEARLLAFTVGRAPPVAPVVGFESLSRCRDVSTRVKLLEP